MKTRLLKLSLLIGMLLLSSGIHAQVTIGSGQKPATGALLDLKEKADGSSTKGLALPRVQLTSNNDIANGDITGVTATNKDAHIGLLVYNTGSVTTSAADRLCPGLHVWDGSKWHSLTAYTVIDDTKSIISKTVTNESRTNISGTTGYTVGPLGQFTDIRGSGGVEVNQYHHARFYTYRVQAIGSVTYEGIKNPYACDASQAIVEQWTETGSFEYIDDGIWMTESLNTEYLTDTSPTKMLRSATENIITPQYISPTNTDADLAQIIQNGLLYNWAAATNQKGGSTGQENVDNPGILNEEHTLHAERQGICPTGWHLPSDKELNELEAVYAISSNNFTLNTTTPFPWNYDLTLSWRPNGQNVFGPGKGMKSITNLTVALAYGDSKTAANGGFNLLLTGLANNGAVTNYGHGIFLWSSSSYDSTRAYFRSVNSNTAGVFRHAVSRNTLHSVRCKKENL